MSYNEENVRQILNEYDFLRAKAENKRDNFVKDIYRKFPRIEEIDAEINRLGFLNTKNIMENPQKSNEYNEAFNNALAQLNEEKEQLLKEKNIPQNYNEPIYSCDLCNDRGYIENDRCSCFQQKLIDKAYQQSNLGHSFYEQSFDDFSLAYYSNRKKQDQEISDRENMEDILAKCHHFCDKFDTMKQGLFLVGSPGLGKTFLSNCIAKELLDQGKTVVYKRAARLFSSYDDFRFGRIDNESFNLDQLYNADLLIIDDLGTENITKSGLSFFFDLLNERIDKGKKMIINTNFSTKDITKFYTGRITSRIYEFFQILHFRGKDIRVQRLEKL